MKFAIICIWLKFPNLLFTLFLISREYENTEISKAGTFIIFQEWVVSLDAQFCLLILPKPLYMPLPILF